VWEGDLQSYSLILFTVGCFPPVSVFYTHSQSYRQHAQFDCICFMRQNSFRLRGAHCRAGVHMLRARQAHGSPLPQAAVTETSAISLGLWWRGGCPGACSEPLTMLRLPQLSCLGPGCPPSVPYHMQQTGTLGNHWVFLL